LEELKDRADPEIDYVLARAYGNLVDETDDAKEALIELSSRPDPRTHNQITQALYALNDALDEPWCREVLAQLAGASTKDSTVLDNLDLHLSELAEKAPSTVVEVLSEFVQASTQETAKTGALTEIFNSSISTLLEQHPAELETAITTWFASGDPRLHRAAAAVVDHHYHATSPEGRPVFNLNDDVLKDLTADAVISVLRRISGHVKSSRSLASLISSALHRDPCPEQIERSVISLLTGYVLYNYPGEAREQLEGQLENGEFSAEEEEAIQQAFTESDAYYDRLGDLPRLNELSPPSHHLSKIRRARRQQQSAFMEKAREESVIQSLFRSVPLKYGSGFYQVEGEGPSEPVPLSEISSEMEIPRGELIDPVGQAYKRIRFRTARDPAQQADSPPDSSS